MSALCVVVAVVIVVVVIIGHEPMFPHPYPAALHCLSGVVKRCLVSLCSFISIVGSLGCVSIRYSVPTHEYHKVQAREASSVGSCINMLDLYKSCFTSGGCTLAR